MNGLKNFEINRLKHQKELDKLYHQIDDKVKKIAEN